MQKAEEIVKKYIRNTDTCEEKIAIIYQWLCENIKYDYDRLGIKDACGTVNGFSKGTCVCEGYTRMMQLMLKMCNVNSIDVSCFLNDECDDYIESAIKHGNHSIIRIKNTDGFDYYIDVTVGAKLYRDGLPRKCFMVSKESLTNGIEADVKAKVLKYQLVLEDEIETGLDFSEEKANKLFDFANNRIRSVNNSLEEKEKNERTLLERWLDIVWEWEDLKYKSKIVSEQLKDLENKINNENYDLDEVLEINGNDRKQQDDLELRKLLTAKNN